MKLRTVQKALLKLEENTYFSYVYVVAAKIRQTITSLDSNSDGSLTWQEMLAITEIAESAEIAEKYDYRIRGSRELLMAQLPKLEVIVSLQKFNRLKSYWYHVYKDKDNSDAIKEIERGCSVSLEESDLMLLAHLAAPKKGRSYLNSSGIIKFWVMELLYMSSKSLEEAIEKLKIEMSVKEFYSQTIQWLHKVCANDDKANPTKLLKELYSSLARGNNVGADENTIPSVALRMIFDSGIHAPDIAMRLIWYKKHWLKKPDATEKTTMRDGKIVVLDDNNEIKANPQLMDCLRLLVQNPNYINRIPIHFEPNSSVLASDIKNVQSQQHTKVWPSLDCFSNETDTDPHEVFNNVSGTMNLQLSNLSETDKLIDDDYGEIQQHHEQTNPQIPVSTVSIASCRFTTFNQVASTTSATRTPDTEITLQQLTTGTTTLGSAAYSYSLRSQ